MRLGRRSQEGVPASALADDLVTAVQPLLTLAIALLCVVTAAPLGPTGALLLIVNTVVALTRTLPDRVVGERARLAISVVGALAAGLFFAVDSNSVAVAFGFVIATHVGIRFEARVALAVTAVAAGTAMALLPFAGDPDAWAWWTPLLLFGATLAGIARRNREQTLVIAHEVVEQTRLAAAAEARAQTLAERARLARELHDVLAHSLSGVNMQLSLADALLEAGRVDDGRDAVRRGQELVVDGLQEARRAVQALREDTIDLVPTLEGMLDGQALQVVGTPVALPIERTIAVVRTAQEALTNARRHAPGAPVSMVLTYATAPDAAVRLEVVNGPPSGAVTSSEGSGLGLVGMRERAALVGADVAAGPAGDGGWRVRLDLPVVS